MLNRSRASTRGGESGRFFATVDRWRAPALGLWSAGATVALTVVTAVLAVTTPPRSGLMCQQDRCVTAPYTDVATFVPRDYLWLYPALASQVAYLLLVAVIVSEVMGDRPSLGLAALGFSVLGSGALIVDYGLQLVVVQPSLVAGETEGLGLLSQYNPHGAFIGLENIGYAALAVAFVLVAAALPRRGPLPGLRWVLLAGGALTWIALVGLAVGYGADLEYRFELAAITINWLVLIIVGTTLAVHLLRAGRERARGPA